MAYPNYYGGYPQQGYQAAGYYPQAVPDQLTMLRQNQMQQPMAQGVPTMQTQQPASGGIIWVQGEEGAKAYMVAAGNSVMLMDSEASAFYIKSTDPSGMPQPLRIFDYVERKAATKTHVQAQQAPAPDYITRTEFEQLEARVNGLTAKPQKTAKAKEEADNG